MKDCVYCDEFSCPDCQDDAECAELYACDTCIFTPYRPKKRLREALSGSFRWFCNVVRLESKTVSNVNRSEGKPD